MTYNLHPFHRDVQLYHWFVVGLSIGPRRVEWAQNALTKSGRAPDLTAPELDDRDGLPRAFMLQDIKCATITHRRIPLTAAVFECPELIDSITFTWRHQKNGENGEEKTITRSSATIASRHCRVRSMLEILRCRMTLAPLDAMVPLAVFQTEASTVAYLTNYDITGMLRSLAAEVYNLDPVKDKKALQRWSSHSLRVGACVLLHMMGFSAVDIKFILRWKSDAFLGYLRNMAFLARRHADAMDSAATIPNAY
jgi:hypothetical protein